MVVDPNPEVIEFLQHDEVTHRSTVMEDLIEEERQQLTGTESRDRDALEQIEQYRRRVLAKKMRKAEAQKTASHCSVSSAASTCSHEGDAETMQSSTASPSPPQQQHGRLSGSGRSPPPKGSRERLASLERILRENIQRETELQKALVPPPSSNSSSRSPSRLTTAIPPVPLSYGTAASTPPPPPQQHQQQPHRGTDDSVLVLEERNAQGLRGQYEGLMSTSPPPARESTCAGAGPARPDLAYMAPVHEALQLQFHAGGLPSAAGEAFTCFDGREISAVSGKSMLSMRPGETGERFLTRVPRYHACGPAGRLAHEYGSEDATAGESDVLQRLWISSVLRQQLLLWISVAFWVVVFAPDALEVAWLTGDSVSSSSSTRSSSPSSGVSWTSGITSQRMLLFTTKSGAGFLCLVLLLVLSGGGLWLLQRPRLLLFILFCGAALVPVGLCSEYVGFTVHPDVFWWPVAGKAMQGAGTILFLAGLIGVTAAEVGITAGVALQLQLGLLLWPVTVFFIVVTIPFVTTYFISDEELFLYGVIILSGVALALPVVLCCLIPPSILREAVVQHNLFAATCSTRIRDTITRLSPRFLLRSVTAAAVLSATWLLVQTAPASLAQMHKSQMMNPYATVAVLCVAAVFMWLWCFIPVLVAVVRSWLPGPIVVVALLVSWLLFFQLDKVPPAVAAAVTGVVVVTICSGVIRSLVNLGTSWATISTGSIRRRTLDEHARVDETTPMLTSVDALSRTPLSGVVAPGVLPEKPEASATATSASAGGGEERNVSVRPGNPFAVLVLAGVCGCLVLSLMTLASAVASSLLRDVEEYPSPSSSRTLIPGVSVEANHALLAVIWGLGGLALLAQVAELIIQRNQWNQLLASPPV